MCNHQLHRIWHTNTSSPSLSYKPGIQVQVSCLPLITEGDHTPERLYPSFITLYPNSVEYQCAHGHFLHSIYMIVPVCEWVCERVRVPELSKVILPLRTGICITIQRVSINLPDKRKPVHLTQRLSLKRKAKIRWWDDYPGGKLEIKFTRKLIILSS